MMAELNLAQADADALIALEKHRIDEQRYAFPLPGGSLAIPLQAPDKREHFLLDVSRGRINILRGKYQSRARQVVVLVRLDFAGPPHRNPDDSEVLCPHLHVYREGFGDKWAIPAPPEAFTDTSNLWTTLDQFMRFCNITRPPHIDQGLF